MITCFSRHIHDSAEREGLKQNLFQILEDTERRQEVRSNSLVVRQDHPVALFSILPLKELVSCLVVHRQPGRDAAFIAVFYTVGIRSSMMASERVDWAAHADRATVEGMGVDHGRLNILVPQQFLDRSNIVSAFQQVRGERMLRACLCYTHQAWESRSEHCTRGGFR